MISDKSIQSKDTIVRMVLDLSVSADVINVILEFVRAGSLPDFITELLNTNLSKYVLDRCHRRHVLLLQVQ